MLVLRLLVSILKRVTAAERDSDLATTRHDNANASD